MGFCGSIFPDLGPCMKLMKTVSWLHSCVNACKEVGLMGYVFPDLWVLHFQIWSFFWVSLMVGSLIRRLEVEGAHGYATTHSDPAQ